MNIYTWGLSNIPNIPNNVVEGVQLRHPVAIGYTGSISGPGLLSKIYEHDISRRLDDFEFMPKNLPLILTYS